MYHFAWADQRPVQGNISYISLQPGQYTLLLLLLLLLAQVTYNQVRPLRINYLAS